MLHHVTDIRFSSALNTGEETDPLIRPTAYTYKRIRMISPLLHFSCQLPYSRTTRHQYL